MAQVQPFLGVKTSCFKRNKPLSKKKKNTQRGLRVPHLGSIFLENQREVPFCPLVNCGGIVGYFGLLSLSSEGHTVSLSFLNLCAHTSFSPTYSKHLQGLTLTMATKHPLWLAPCGHQVLSGLLRTRHSGLLV